jgi:alpha-mannosidase
MPLVQELFAGKDSQGRRAKSSLQDIRNRLIATLEIESTLKVPAQLSADRHSRAKKLVNLPVRSRIALAHGVPRVDIRTEVDNTTKDHRLRVHFPAPFVVDQADYDGHFEVVRRPIGVPEKGEDWVEDPRPEVPQRAFTNISNGKVGLTIANRGLPKVEALQNGAHTEVALTLLRSVGWLSRDDMSARVLKRPTGRCRANRSSTMPSFRTLAAGKHLTSRPTSSKQTCAPSKPASIPENSPRREVL